MTFGLRRDVLRPHESPRTDRVTYVELFFDLVFVFALTQLGAYLYEHQTPLGALEGVTLLCALWWAWVSTTWVTNWLDPVRLPVRAAVIALAFVAFVMSVSIAEAFGDRAWAFAIAYVVLQVGRTGVPRVGHGSTRRAGGPRLRARARVDGGRRRALDRRRAAAPAAATAALGRRGRARTPRQRARIPGARPRTRRDQCVGCLGAAHRRTHRAVRAHRARRGAARHRIRLRRHRVLDRPRSSR